MDFSELSNAEIMALVALAKHLVHADGQVSGTEMLDLMSIGEAVGMDRFSAALDATKDRYKSREAVLQMADLVQRYDARVLIYVLCEELAKSDGTGKVEEHVLVAIRQRWGF